MCHTQCLLKTCWQDGELLPLDDAAELRPESSLRALHTPGHTADGLSIWDPLVSRQAAFVQIHMRS